MSLQFIWHILDFSNSISTHPVYDVSSDLPEYLTARPLHKLLYPGVDGLVDSVDGAGVLLAQPVCVLGHPAGDLLYLAGDGDVCVPDGAHPVHTGGCGLHCLVHLHQLAHWVGFHHSCEVMYK